jgi:hypothetical protein
MDMLSGGTHRATGLEQADHAPHTVKPIMMYQSGWSNFHIGAVSPSKLAFRGREVLGYLESRGIRIPGGNRLQQAIRLTERLNEGKFHIRSDSPELNDRVREAFRTLWELFVITFAAVERRRHPDPFPNDLLLHLLRGAELPAGESNPKARNTQFELYTVASLVLGGADVRPGEPDCTFLYHGNYIGVAAKRLTSTKPLTLQAEVRDAAKQLSSHGLCGFVALSLDAWLAELEIGEDPSVVGRSFTKLLQEAYRCLDRVSAREAVLGAMLHGHLNRWHFDDAMPRLEWHAPSQFVGFTDTEMEVARFRQFFGPLRDRFEGRLAEIASHVQLSEKPA